MSLLYVVGDPHFSATPVNRTGDLVADVLAKMQYVRSVAGTAPILYLGDFFEDNKPMSPRHISELIAFHKDLPYYTLLGNHDRIYNTDTSVAEGNLGILLAAGVVSVLDSVAATDSIAGMCNVAVLHAYDTVDSIQNIAAEVLFMHGRPSESTTDVRECVYSMCDIKARLPHLKYVIYGHIHDYNGEHTVGGVPCLGMGSLTRRHTGELYKAERYYAVVDLETPISVTHHVIPSRPYSETFVVRDKFVGQFKDLMLATEQTHHTDPITVIQHVLANVPQEVANECKAFYAQHGLQI